MPDKRILILGGTQDAIEIAQLAHAAGYDVTTSLAGVTRAPKLPIGAVRSGGFGGAEAMAAFIRAQGFVAVVDATHPFAAQISRAGFEAAGLAAIPYARLERPAWQAQSGDNWVCVPDIAAAVAALPPNAKVFLTVGRKAVPQFMARADLSGIARMIEPPPQTFTPGWTLLLARPPFDVEEEKGLMQLECITHLVTKNSGGEMTRSKLVAARDLFLPVIMIERPDKPKALCFSDLVLLTKFLAENI